MSIREVLIGNSPRELAIAAGIAVGVMVIVALVRWALMWRFRHAHKTATDVDDFLLDSAQRTKLLLILVPAIFLGARALTMPREIYRLLKMLANLSLIAQFALWAAGFGDLWLRRYRRTRVERDPSSQMTVHIFRIAIISAVWIIAFLFALENLGYNIGTIIAGLGIGGVAVALAMQNILGDLFASLSIVIDKPFVIGDTISVDQFTGTVEQVGLKTTRIRAISGEELVFSNGDLLKSRVRNFKRMTERRGSFRVGVVYGTPVEKLERIPTLLQSLIEKHERARFERAHFVALGESACEFEAVYFVTTPEYKELAAVQQAINLDILRTFAAEQIDLAFPTRTVIVAKP
ncbi:MAG TPA: mechanosensitive ion channel family protein [Thermoanaerobaculia bacterium]|nr:mechanosensitive ion channel family protein [Thermoanaerobaculia bacterium]